MYGPEERAKDKGKEPSSNPVVENGARGKHFSKKKNQKHKGRIKKEAEEGQEQITSPRSRNRIQNGKDKREGGC